MTAPVTETEKKLAIGIRKGKPRGDRGRGLKAAGAPYRWLPGQSGNPKGGRKKSRITEVIKDSLSLPVIDAETGKPTGLTVAEKIGLNVLTRALDEVDGRPDTQLILDRLEGPISALSVGGERGVKEFALRVVYDDLPTPGAREAAADE